MCVNFLIFTIFADLTLDYKKKSIFSRPLPKSKFNYFCSVNVQYLVTSVVPGLFFGRAGVGKFLRAGARTRAGAGPTFFDRAAGQGRAGAKK